MAVEYCLGLEDNRRKTSTFFLYIYIFKSDVVGEVWREFCWGAIAGAFGEGMMHPVDTVKTRIQSQAILSGGIQTPKSLLQMVRAVAVTDGARGI